MSEKIRKYLIIRVPAFPSRKWGEKVREIFGAEYGKKSEVEFPIWMRITGNGYIIWFSEFRIGKNEDEWIIALERLKNLNPDGLSKEEEFLAFAMTFFDDLEIKEEAAT